MIQLKTKKQIDLMREAGRALAYWMQGVAFNLRYGVMNNGQKIEEDLKLYIARSLAKPERYDTVFDKVKDYGSPICVSINDEIVHSRPTKKPFEVGDIITIDAGLSYKGWMADMARTAIYGEAGGVINKKASELVKATRIALHKGEQQCKPGNKISDISTAIREKAREHG